ncbi:hypothetical protein A3D00_00920 [Candidatus Woesebacteria bacterium RIFCSPHIGHO2_02_FULL_38_9]|uniref:Glycosyltransferase RgtA/B/C/D-like domain-containing protein n=1 Tax=Candidatus Woesebacteria bacterium RIFCSPHIGHO2_01_FULL_39_28 TaxID=1802496 RepID=A0A1F7YF00_9BACT|nr:MAG: hypothetical protein A2627_02250 [Candidatus Woesebacteria bacterium RIFCSPHIGHO2_01_FULL_39_28]OGM31419.1 MAG: hypothetical protein A3D00_00920 [Candidatus Woesebacteria bacterium RIFCSPHIGHO2_02_FULL_38_9]OGM58157.1 MAG: hypothetical protein A3A50_00130 [Candidatus Woesebacteria bacterium RIFCSPLOWO2_01_FULL_38_20]
MAKTSLKLSITKKEILLLGLILLVGAFLRLYRISEHMTFLGDEGRDAIIVRRIFAELHPPLIGPGTSIGNMYLGPLYYYLMAPALLFAGFNPIGPAIMIAVLGVATIFLVWKVTSEFFGELAAWVAATLYAVSPTVITYSRSSWNPNIMPFFALLSIYTIWRVWQKKEYKWLVTLGISFAFVLQSHYLGLLLAPILVLFWLLALLKIKNFKLTENWKLKIGNFAKYSLVGFGIFSLLMSPLVIFDARHGWQNFGALRKFFTERQITVSIRPWNAIPQIYPLFEKVNTRLITGKNELFGRLLSLLMIGLLGMLVFSKKNRSLILKPSYLLLSLWLSFALIGLGLYKQEIYDHYYGFFFPAPFLLLGALAQEALVIRHEGLVNKTIAYCLLPIAFTGLIVVNLKENPLRYSPNRQLQRTQEVVNKIAIESNGRNFNLAVIAERNYEDAYKYFLLWKKKPVVDIDPQKANDTITNQLFVVCEMEEVKCDPTHNPKAQVANFGWSKIENEWQIAGVTLYKLVHTQ